MDLEKYSAFIKRLGAMYFLLLISTMLLFASLLNSGAINRDGVTMIPLLGAYYAMLAINARNKKAFWFVIITSFIPYAVFIVAILHLLRLRVFFSSKNIDMKLLGPKKESINNHLEEVKLTLSKEKESNEKESKTSYFNA